MSHRQRTERRELLLPPGTDWHSKSLPKRVIRFDAELEAESCCLATPVSCGLAEPPHCWTRDRVHGPAVAQADQTAYFHMPSSPALLVCLPAWCFVKFAPAIAQRLMQDNEPPHPMTQKLAPFWLPHRT